MNAGFYRFDVHFFDGAEQNAHGFVYAENYANAVEKVCDMVEDEDIADIKIEGMEPGEVLLMPDWIADKIVKYDYFIDHISINWPHLFSPPQIFLPKQSASTTSLSSTSVS